MFEKRVKMNYIFKLTLIIPLNNTKISNIKLCFHYIWGIFSSRYSDFCCVLVELPKIMEIKITSESQKTTCSRRKLTCYPLSNYTRRPLDLVDFITDFRLLCHTAFTCRFRVKRTSGIMV